MQLALQLKNKAPAITEADVELLCERLRGRDWQLARQLCEEHAYNDRSLRAIAAASDGRIISGQRGYRLNDRSATVEEIDHAATWLEAQAREMLKRAAAIRRRYHRYARPNKG